MDTLFTNGVIAVREKSLLGERIKRLCEGTAEEAFRQIAEIGFGNGAEACSARDYEALIAAEERATDEFIRTFSPSGAERDYLLLPRDFHNAGALVKAEYLSLDASKMLSPEGNYPVAKLTAAVQSGDCAKLGILGETIAKAAALFRERDTAPTGAELGTLFLQGLFEALKKSCAKNKATRRLLTRRADMTNILTVFRSDNEEQAKKLYVSGGELTEKELSRLFGDAERAERAFAETPYATFVKSCFEARRAGVPYTQAERMLAGWEIEEFSRRRFELNGSEAFLYYVFRRRAECDDVRIVFVCLNAGMQEGEIKKRLRSLREGS